MWKFLKNPKLVKFANGKFGIRYGWLFHRYQDFTSQGMQWPLASQFIEDCQEEEAVVRQLYVNLVNPPQVVK